ncbi:hypothetical protein [Pedosphaera parvula]|uniref:Uncharacterized protein n=1 Tax=Pedosphaera parvula (strain Ellin514) TaxID=320771 RepID=B9XFT4_PEDPL|nr:hypothetical protein [Pedosphaera parvula]EEF61448.1 hypothetical protein Cflav_PD4469 [Pedosphaera parvula Ellin514]
MRLIQFKILLCVVVWGPAFSASAKDAEAKNGSTKPLVLAFYHPWYGTPWGPTGKWKQWSSFKFPERYHPEKVVDGWKHQIASGDYPLIGAYDTSDPEVVRWHFRLAKAAGIDGFLCSWWNVGREDGYWSEQYKLFETVWLPVAEQENFKIGIIDECAHYIHDYGQLVSRITNCLPRYAKSPAYLRIKGQPVWFVYQVWEDWITPEIANKYVNETEKQIGDVYWIFGKMKATATKTEPGAVLSIAPDWLAVEKIDCFGTYSLFGNWRETREPQLTQLYQGFAENVRKAGKEVQLTILPGHNNTAVEEKPYVAARERGKVLKNFCKAVDETKPEVAVVCSFNEWFEMTEIEPAANWDDPYLYLKILAEWRGKEWKAPSLPPEKSIDPLIIERGRK